MVADVREGNCVYSVTVVDACSKQRANAISYWTTVEV